MVSVIAGTNRKDSNSAIFTDAISKILKTKDVEHRVLNLVDLPEDFVFTNEVYGGTNQTLLEIQDKHVTEADKFVFVLPEYNGSFPGVAKAFIDSFSPSRIHNKKALLVGISSGRAGNLRGMEHFTGVLNYLRVAVYPFKPAVAHCTQVIEDNEVKDEKTLNLLSNTLDDFLAF